MEEVETQVASPLFIHQNIPPRRFCDGGLIIGKKRSVCYSSSINHKQQLYPSNHRVGDGWNPKDWDWDSTRFVARARPPPEGSTPHLGTVSVASSSSQSKLVGDGDQIMSSPVMSKNSEFLGDDEVVGSSLRLQLGGVVSDSGNIQNLKANSVEDPSPSRPSKKVRSGSPRSGGNCPTCQVDSCIEDLSKSKDYHRRHKVCELHSKATKAIVGNQVQRFCQQCSRFHPLSEFDEGKRSCRRRLAGHNRRRRKNQPEDATTAAVQPVDGNKAVSTNLDIVNLLKVIATGQLNTQQNAPAFPSLPDNNQLIQILSKMNALPVQADAIALFSQRKNPFDYTDKNKSSSEDKEAGLNASKKPNMDLPSLEGERSSSSYQSPTEDLDCQDQEIQINLPMQLFHSSPRNGSPPNVTSSGKYLSSDSSNPSVERSPSSSPPVTRKLFPLEATSEIANPVRMSFSGDGTSTSRVTLELFNAGNRDTDSEMQTSPYPAGCASSGSDYSPPSFNSDPQMDRTGRIIFKLFDKDPSHLPAALRTQVYSWLSNSPSEIESYIRPGCVVLSVYVAMSSASWAQLEENFLLRVNTLIQGSDSEFWKNGRFSVNIDRQFATHSDGRIRICKPWSSLSSPELFVVTPLAVVSGRETSLLLRGRNLTCPGTKIHCTYMGGYSTKEIIGSCHQDYIYDKIKLDGFKVHAAPPAALGRCFIEVENGVRGNSFPLIIADEQICQELRLLEGEFIKEGKVCDDQVQIIGGRGSLEEVLHFLNELGWLFQRQISNDHEIHDYLPHRFQFLLTFCVERDYCALVMRLLNIFVGRDSGMDRLSTESVDALAKMHLLHRAVKRKSKNMVDLLIHYYVPCKGATAKNYIFPPNLRGPGGVSPLHLAACTSESFDIVHVLTDDPMQIGLNSWRSLLDDCSQSPYAYATMRNNQPLNNLVHQKLVGRRNGQVSVSIRSNVMEIELPSDSMQMATLQTKNTQKSCSRCASMSYSRMSSSGSVLHRPFIHSMLAVSAVCVCVCLLFKSLHVNPGVPFRWDDLGFGTI